MYYFLWYTYIYIHLIYGYCTESDWARQLYHSVAVPYPRHWGCAKRYAVLPHIFSQPLFCSLLTRAATALKVIGHDNWTLDSSRRNLNGCSSWWVFNIQTSTRSSSTRNSANAARSLPGRAQTSFATSSRPGRAYQPALSLVYHKPFVWNIQKLHQDMRQTGCLKECPNTCHTMTCNAQGYVMICRLKWQTKGHREC